MSKIKATTKSRLWKVALTDGGTVLFILGRDAEVAAAKAARVIRRFYAGSAIRSIEYDGTLDA